MSTQRPPEDAPEQHAPDRPRQRRSTIIAASVAAAVLLAGGGGAYWASTAGDGGSAPAAGDPPPLRLDGYAGAAEGPGIAPGEPDPAGRTYVAEGELPDGPDAAPVHRPRGEVGRAAAERLARALDVPGPARLAGDTWKFGPLRDATGPKLDVARNAPGTWTYQRFGPAGSDDCAEPPAGPEKKEQEQDGPGKGSGSDSSSSSAKCPVPPDGPAEGEPVSEAEAKRAAGPVLKAAGLADAAVDAGTATGAVRVVNADPVVDGLPTYGWHTGLRIGPGGDVVGGSGHLAKLGKGPEYPVLGAEEALERLNRSAGGGRVGIGGCASAVPHADGSEPGSPSCGEPATAPSALPAPARSGQDDPAQDGPAGEGSGGEDTERSEPDRTTPAEPGPATVRKAVFGYAAHFVAGKQALVPAWLFAVEAPGAGEGDTFTVTYPAVKPEHIAGNGGSSAPGDRPTSGPAEPGGPGGDEGLTRVETYSTDGRKLTVRFWGGVCTDYELSAESTEQRVTVRITGTEKEPGRACVKMAKMMKETVELKEPLGDRRVVDAADGERVPRKE
ncbi:hypothetical protein [Streptomyces xinghaiensis]|uniref:hypothetical protein n=1 Tax=Streptomyces xinghaiensis TaxID=1038928 RepID=UPI000BAFDDF9|nr:hypothetical protein [Streptomyces xinghaiensis]